MQFDNALGRQRQRVGGDFAVGIKLDVAQPAKRRHHLILRADGLAHQLLLDVDAFLGQLHLGAQAPTQGVQGVNQPDGKGGARAHATAGRQIAVVMQLQAALEIQMLQRRPNHGMNDLIDGLAGFNLPVDEADAMIEEWRQVAARQIAVFVDAGRQHRAAVIAIPARVVRAAAEKRDAIRSATDYHP